MRRNLIGSMSNIAKIVVALMSCLLMTSGCASFQQDPKIKIFEYNLYCLDQPRVPVLLDTESIRYLAENDPRAWDDIKRANAYWLVKCGEESTAS